MGAVVAGVAVTLLVDRGGSAAAPRTAGLPRFVPDAARRRLAPAFDAAAHESRVPVALVMAVTWRESEWTETLVSSAGAVGIGQLLPPTSVFVAQALLHDARLDPRRAVDNIRLTARYLRELIDTFHGDARLGVGAYLQGSTSVATRGLTPQTVDYVNQVTALQAQFAAAHRVR